MGETMSMKEFSQEEIDGACKKVISEGGVLSDALGIDPKTIEAGYSIAYKYLQVGNYKDAEPLFQVLCLYDNLDPRFSMGLGLCRQSRGDFFPAADAFMAASITSFMKDPLPLYNMAICFLKLGKKDDAILALEKVVEIPKESATQQLISTCEELLESIKK